MRFVLGRQLGEGVDGVVRFCSDESTGQQFACKSVPKSNTHGILHARTEIAHLLKLQQQQLGNEAAGNPHIIRLYEHFEDEEAIHIVLEFCAGGDLSGRFQCTPSGRLSEPEAAHVFVAICKGLSFCHQKGIMHRDLKLENILFPHLDSPWCHAKLADFGASADLSRKRFFTDTEGTVDYIAPEVLSSGYDEKADVWSLGVLLHILLSGYSPFLRTTAEETFRAIQYQQLNLKMEPWSTISKEAKDLVKGMLHKNPYRRLKLRELLSHSWVQKLTISQADVQCWAAPAASACVFVGG